MAPGPPLATASELGAATGVRRVAGRAGPGARRCPPGRGKPGRAGRDVGSAGADRGSGEGAALVGGGVQGRVSSSLLRAASAPQLQVGVVTQ